MKAKILNTHARYQEWLDSLSELTTEQATSPYAPGKWSPNEIVMHLAEWDRFTNEERLPNMKEGAKLERYPEFETFNANAAALAQKQTFEETITYAKQQRQQITQKLEAVEESEWPKEFFIGDHALSILSYFTDFAEHDEHHKRQIEGVRVNKSNE
ncbi:MAG: DinB family protein [Paenisporosarcina sp.]